MVTLGFAGAEAAFDPLILLMLGMLIEGYLGEAPFIWRRLPHPVSLIGRLIAFFDDKLNRPKRRELDRIARGLLVVVFMVALSAVTGVGILWVTLHFSYGWVLELVVIVSLLASRNLYNHVARVKEGLDLGGIAGGREAVAHIVGRDPQSLDAPGVARAAIESLAENFSDGVAAPVFWYVVLGMPGMLVYKTVNTLDSMIGHRTPRHQAFGFTAARLDDVLNAIPARLSAAIFVLAAMFVPTARPLHALKTAFRDAGKHRSFNAGWPEAAVAGALGLALAGPRLYGDQTVSDHWMGDGKAAAAPKDIHRALYLYAVACLITAGLVGGVAALRLQV